MCLIKKGVLTQQEAGLNKRQDQAIKEQAKRDKTKKM